MWGPWYAQYGYKANQILNKLQCRRCSDLMVSNSNGSELSSLMVTVLVRITVLHSWAQHFDLQCLSLYTLEYKCVSVIWNISTWSVTCNGLHVASPTGWGGGGGGVVYSHKFSGVYDKKVLKCWHYLRIHYLRINKMKIDAFYQSQTWKIAPQSFKCRVKHK